jgi:hypothetical protein
MQSARDALPAALRSRLTWAAVASGAASIYWALLTLLTARVVASKELSATQLVFPVILVGLYAFRAIQTYRGNAQAVVSLLYLNGLGAIISLYNMRGATQVVIVLQGVKVLIHIFGLITAWRARQAFARAYDEE